MDGATCVSLIVTGPALDPEGFTRALGLAPTPRRPRDAGRDPSATGDGGDRTWRYTVSGATPVDAPRRAHELCAVLLDRLEPVHSAWDAAVAPHQARVEIAFDLPRLLTFSWEMGADVVTRLATLRVPLDFVLEEATAGLAVDHPATRGRTSARLGYLAHDLDPDALTARLGIEPTRIERPGESGPPDHGQTHLPGQWLLESTSSDADAALQDVTADLLARLPPTPFDTTHARVTLSTVVASLTRRMPFDAVHVRRLAALACPVAFYLYNEGA